MEVVIFSQEYPPHSWGGVTPFAVNLVNGLAALGVGVHLVTIGSEDEEIVTHNGVRIHRFKSEGIYVNEVWNTEEGVVRDYILARRLQKRFATANLSCVILADGVSFPEARFLAKALKKPLITMVNQIFADIAHLWAGKLDDMKVLENKYFALSDVLVAGSQCMYSRLVDLGWGGKSRHISYGYGFNAWPRKCEVEVLHADFLFVGRLVPEKGVLDLLDAFAIIQKEYPSVTLNVVGDGPLMKDLKEPAERAHSRITPMDRNSDIFSAANCTIVPSKNEPFGYVALESIVFGAMPLVTNNTGLTEITRHIDWDCLIPAVSESRFVQRVNVEHLAQKMRQTLNLAPEKRRQILDNARTKVMQEFNYVKTASEWLTLINGLAA